MAHKMAQGQWIALNLDAPYEVILHPGLSLDIWLMIRRLNQALEECESKSRLGATIEAPPEDGGGGYGKARLILYVKSKQAQGGE